MFPWKSPSVVVPGILVGVGPNAGELATTPKEIETELKKKDKRASISRRFPSLDSQIKWNGTGNGNGNGEEVSKRKVSLTLTENDYSTDSFVESENDPYLSTFDRLHSKIQTNLPRSGSSDIKMTKE